MADPTAHQLKAVKMAITYKAVRFLKFPESPLGTWGEWPDGAVGFVSVKPDYQIEEYLSGLRGVDIDWDDEELAELVNPAHVIRVGLGSPEPETLPEGYEEWVQDAIDAALHWVAQHISQETAWGIA